MNCAIIKLTLISKDTYSRVVYNTGIAFADYYYGNDFEVVTLITSSKAYWDWWRNQFEQTNDAFIKRHESSRWDSQKFCDLWMKCHEPESVIAYPSQYVVEEAMSRIWGKVWKEEHVLNHQKRQTA